MTDIDVPVLIIGGGGVGLSSSIFLSNLGVDHLLVERHADTSILPKAHYLNQRTMEVFRQHGVAEAILEVGAPIEKFGKVRWVTSLGGDAPMDQKLIHEMDAFGGGATYDRYAADSPVLSSNYPQIRLEKLLRAQADKRAPGKVLFHHEVTDWEQTDAGVAVTVLNRDTEETYTIRARYVIAADGGKTVGPKVGVQMTGPTNMVDMVSTHFTADLSQYWDDGTLITWFLNPEGKDSWGSGAMVQMGPTWGRNSEEWVLHFAFQPDDPERFNEEAIVPRLRTLLKLPDLDVKVHKVSHWILDRIVAEQWRYGDIFLAGDSAHRQPPTSGLGLNTGIQDAHNIAWKLAEVIAGRAGDALLDTYESERKPVSTHGADWALLAFMNHFVIDAGVGLIPGAPPEVNTRAFASLLSDTPMGETLRARAAHALNTQRMEFCGHDVEIGFHYPAGAFIPDGSNPPPRDPLGEMYTPATRPGHRLPHAWLGHQGGRVSTLDLVRPEGGFVLITDDSGDAWTKAAAQAGDALGVEVRVVPIGHGEYTDDEGTWPALRGVQDGGAVLVRPDQFVAMRSAELPADPAAALEDGLRQLLSSTS
jgi:2,4-dichlorophenol 6-monooxygenase